jgi:uncharacterized low-complexity protein
MQLTLFNLAESSVRSAGGYQRPSFRLSPARNRPAVSAGGWQRVRLAAGDVAEPAMERNQSGRLMMRMIVLAFSLMALAAPAHAAQKTNARNNDASIEQKCREMVRKEQYEGEGRGGVGRLQAQRFGECMVGMPH